MIVDIESPAPGRMTDDLMRRILDESSVPGIERDNLNYTPTQRFLGAGVNLGASDASEDRSDLLLRKLRIVMDGRGDGVPIMTRPGPVARGLRSGDRGGFVHLS